MKAKYIIISVAMAFGFNSCVNDLNTVPIDPNETTSESVYGTPESYKQGLAKCYGAFAVSGQTGGESGEIIGVDAGLSTFLRSMWNMQELTTDLAACAWEKDQAGYPVINTMTWGTTSNETISALYYRITFSVSIMNEYLKQTSDEKLAARGTSAELKAEIQNYRTEARFLRALMYYYGMDLFGNIPFTTEADPIGKYFPKQISRADLFKYVQSELLAVEPLMAEPKGIEFGRADKAAVWTTLSRMYLNAQVYIGENRYTDAITWSRKVIESPVYGLASNYSNLFKSDNDKTNPDVWKEIIFSINFDKQNTEAYATSILVNGSRQGGVTDNGNPGGNNWIEESGTNFAWAGFRAKSNLVDLFPNSDTENSEGFLVSPDSRCIIYKRGRNKAIGDQWRFADGYGVYKWRSVSSTGVYSMLQYSSTDYPIMRLAEVYLTYAEAVVRGGAGGSRTNALNYVNALRERAYGNTNGNIVDGDMTVAFFLGERGRELYWEGFRRTDLIRYDKYTSGDYVWPWKGGSNVGRAVSDAYNLLPIPFNDLVANPNLKQNPLY